MVWLSVLLLVSQATCWVAAVMGPNTCSRQETYTVTMRILEKKPITIKTYTWCFKIPPRCTKYKQQVVDHYKIQTEPRTRWVTECCPGYLPDAEDLYCEPHCPLGCEHGNCTAPHECSCHPGYFGVSCNKECPDGQWGPACQHMCSCLNSATCHSETGHCSCSPGYWGTRCESICPSGTYGERCEMRCLCAGAVNTCHHITGTCDTPSGCNESSPCQTEWTPTQPEVVQQLLNNVRTTDGRPVPEPLVTTSEDIRTSDTVPNESVPVDRAQLSNTSTLEYFANSSESEFVNTAIENENDGTTTTSTATPTTTPTTPTPISTTTPTPISTTTPTTTTNTSTTAPTTTSTTPTTISTPAPSTTRTTTETLSSVLDLHRNSDIPTTSTTMSRDDGRVVKETSSRFVEEESHEDQLEHRRPSYETEHTSVNTETTQEVDEVSELFSEPPENQGSSRTKTLQEGFTDDTNQEVMGQESELLEISTQGPYQQVGKVEEHAESDLMNLTKNDEQRKKFTDQKKYKMKARLKDIPNQKPDTFNQKPVDMDHDWLIPEQEHEESPKHYEHEESPKHYEHEESPKQYEHVQEGPHRDHMEKVVDTGKPKKVLDQKRVKDVADIGQLKIEANQERQLADNKKGYNDFLSSFSIAAGVSTGIIMVVGLITLMARCRRAKPKQEAVTSVEMETVNNQQENARASVVPEETIVPVVRPLFFSPVYLPGDVSPTEGNGGLIVTAVFSRPGSNIHDLYRQQELLRETLTPHYDVPPPTGTRNSICTSIGTAETEHVYEELPCWRNQSASPLSESQC